jgi:hypothetical protein
LVLIVANCKQDNFQTTLWFLATFGDLGWGKAEGRGQRAEGKRKKGRSNKFKL